MTQRKLGVNFELVYSISLSHACWQRHRLKTLAFIFNTTYSFFLVFSAQSNYTASAIYQETESIEI